MNITDLFKGVAVVIDDEIGGSNANTNNIVRQIKSLGVPVLEYKELRNDLVDHFQNLSFVLLDWKLDKSTLKTDYSTLRGNQLEEAAEKENIRFIKKLNEQCFCPIFIFTNEETRDIEDKLEQEGLVQDGKPSNLLVKRKSDLGNDGSLLAAIGEWLRATPSIYVLKEWEKEYQKCKTNLFYDFHQLSPFWPKVMWDNFESDGVNKSLEMGNLISRNLHSRMEPFEFSEEILSGSQQDVSSEELRKILEGERFLEGDKLHDDDIGTGDVFKEEYEDSGETKFRYYLNVRAQCDLLRGQGDTELYCLRGRVYGADKRPSSGHFVEKINHAIVPFLDGGQVIEFLFRDLKVKKWSELREVGRVGRLLPPHITRIQQRYALYMQREGVPRIPDEAFD